MDKTDPFLRVCLVRFLYLKYMGQVETRAAFEVCRFISALAPSAGGDADCRF